VGSGCWDTCETANKEGDGPWQKKNLSEQNRM